MNRKRFLVCRLRRLFNAQDAAGRERIMTTLEEQLQCLSVVVVGNEYWWSAASIRCAVGDYAEAAAALVSQFRGSERNAAIVDMIQLFR